MKINIYCDGGSRGNPGPSAAAFVVFDGQQNIIHKDGKYLGIQTNNFAEYSAIKMAFEWLSKYAESIEKVDFILDSELAVKQLNGLYKIKNPTLQSFVRDIKALWQDMPYEVTVSHSLREGNLDADTLVNKTLDLHEKSTL
ncbi:reverse transcriptase-like protein [Candidatus Microgenomates bacterium]|nr:MAG: reverse transcriptase-like protein [Candidatus Microgenomates bacterium]